MKNIYRLKWSDEALSGLNAIFDYLERKFSEKDISIFAKKLDKKLEILKHTPEAFPKSKASNYARRAVVAKLTSIYYRIEEEEVNIISVYDNRMNPKKLKF